mmetsp:Transcript_13828/g.38904  ORF Transcript_13828/g.38904 Transcript_13828/m.38904 type:complete len:100 (+) Transcript_13828:147-446(+)
MSNPAFSSLKVVTTSERLGQLRKPPSGSFRSGLKGIRRHHRKPKTVLRPVSCRVVPCHPVPSRATPGSPFVLFRHEKYELHGTCRKVLSMATSTNPSIG